MKVKCNKCGHIGEVTEFPHSRDFFQDLYISGCPKCDNRQSPGDASMRAFGGARPFQYVRDNPSETILDEVLHRASEAS